MTENTAPGAQQPPAAAVPQLPATEVLCLQLGWSMQRLYRARLGAQAAGEMHPGQLPSRLPGLSHLPARTRTEIDRTRAQTCVDGITRALSWTGDGIPSTAPLKAQLNGPAGEAQRQAYKGEVLHTHVGLLTAIAGTGARLGKAYNLGRALADTARPSQSDDDLRDSFDPYRLSQLQRDLHDLASVLPAHAAKAVAQSLTWWRDAVYMADGTDTGKIRRRSMGNVRTDAPALRRPRAIPNRKISATGPTGDLKTLRQALPRQGELWRLVLTGEKDPLDLLTPDDYLAAGRRAVARGRRLAVQTIMASPKTTIALFLLVSGVLAAVLAVIWYSHASSGGKLAAFLVAVGGYLVSLARAGLPRVKAAAAKLEKPLWESALDYVCAEGISVPPVGLPDAAGWSHLAQDAAPGPAEPAPPGVPPEPAPATVPPATVPPATVPPATVPPAPGAAGSEAGTIPPVPAKEPEPG